MNRILIIDDDKDVLDTLSLILEIGGYDILGLLEVDSLNENIKTFKPDLIVLDVVLGNIDGRSICNQLKQNPVTKSIPILMMSGLLEMKKVNENTIGPDDFISKPFEMENFVSKVTKLIAQKKSKDYTIN
ncbi:response regulator [Pedobacter flavus]|uniref:Response regulator n=1 Tax=Pedobacter flavus TaxID=3113906 RepID=A0ABU7GXQ2_9SPHI|nr:response regulator [Pedobacter sp. VNH31]MEE1883809.1 response regulator [Pedobacter sp. VNH31]